MKHMYHPSGSPREESEEKEEVENMSKGVIKRWEDAACIISVCCVV